MATSTAAATLTAAEQQAAARVAAQYAALAYALWTRWSSSDDVDQNWLRIIDLLIPQILKARTQVAGTSRTYYQAFRKLEVPTAASWKPDTPLVSLDRSVLETSLRVTGPVAFKKKLDKISGADLAPAVQKALVAKMFKEAGEGMAAATIRHVSDGARQQLEADIKLDPVAFGYMRITKSADPCYFCAMLASRGAVYTDESFDRSDPRFIGDGTAKAHDNCSCVLEPVYSRASSLTPIAKEAATIWGDLKPAAGQTSINAFRAAWESR
jgi:hypothetical protein